jgi:hypothetical protein
MQLEGKELFPFFEEIINNQSKLQLKPEKWSHLVA